MTQLYKLDIRTESTVDNCLSGTVLDYFGARVGRYTSFSRTSAGLFLGEECFYFCSVGTNPHLSVKAMVVETYLYT